MKKLSIIVIIFVCICIPFLSKKEVYDSDNMNNIEEDLIASLTKYNEQNSSKSVLLGSDNVGYIDITRYAHSNEHTNDGIINLEDLDKDYSFDNEYSAPVLNCNGYGISSSDLVVACIGPVDYVNKYLDNKDVSDPLNKVKECIAGTGIESEFMYNNENPDVQEVNGEIIVTNINKYSSGSATFAAARMFEYDDIYYFASIKRYIDESLTNSEDLKVQEELLSCIDSWKPGRTNNHFGCIGASIETGDIIDYDGRTDSGEFAFLNDATKILYKVNIDNFGVENYNTINYGLSKRELKIKSESNIYVTFQDSDSFSTELTGSEPFEETYSYEEVYSDQKYTVLYGIGSYTESIIVVYDDIKCCMEISIEGHITEKDKINIENIIKGIKFKQVVWSNSLSV